MRLTIVLLGHTFDLSLEPTVEQAGDDRERDLSGGTTASTVVGFVAAHQVPDEVAIVRPTSPWEDDSET